MSVGGFINKGIGAIGLGLVLYDAHTLGKINSSSHQKNMTADHVAHAFEQTLSQDSPSIVQSKVKKRVSNFMIDQNLTEFFTGAGGYFRGVGKMLVDKVIPLGLSVGTLATRGTVSKCFGAGLLAYGAIFLLRETLGFFKPKEFNKDF